MTLTLSWALLGRGLGSPALVLGEVERVEVLVWFVWGWRIAGIELFPRAFAPSSTSISPPQGHCLIVVVHAAGH